MNALTNSPDVSALNINDQNEVDIIVECGLLCMLHFVCSLLVYVIGCELVTLEFIAFVRTFYKCTACISIQWLLSTSCQLSL